MSSEPFSIAPWVAEAAQHAGAAEAAAWLKSVSPAALKKLWLSDLPSVLLGGGAPVEVILASWPRSEARDAVVTSVLGELAQSSTDLRAWWFEGATSWVDIRPVHPDPAEVARHAHLGSLCYAHADELANEVNGLPFAFEPNPTSWTGSGSADKHYLPGEYVPGGSNLPPYYRLDDVLANGVAGLVVEDIHLPALMAAARARGCEATVLGPLENTPAKVISWDGQGFGINLTVLQSAPGGYWIFREDVH